MQRSALLQGAGVWCQHAEHDAAPLCTGTVRTCGRRSSYGSMMMAKPWSGGDGFHVGFGEAQGIVWRPGTK